MKQQDRRVELPLQTRVAPLAGVDEKARTANLVWSTGARVRRQDFWSGEQFFEELSMDPAHIRMERLNRGAPLLNTHNRWDLEGVIGVVESASVSNGEGRAAVRFSERADVEPIFRDVASGIIRNVSVGYVVHRYERSTNDAGELVMRAVDWEPSELSLVPVGADSAAGVRSDTKKTYPCVIQTREANMQNARPSGEELERVRTIRELCERNNLQGLALDLITEGTTLPDARARVLDELAKKSGETIRSGFEPVGEGRDTARLTLMAEALASRFGGPKASAQAEHFQHMKVVDIARYCLEARGIRSTGLRPREILERSYAGNSGSDFPGLLQDTGSRILRQSYGAFQSGITKVFRQTTAPDFRTRYVLALSEAPALLEIKPGGEYKAGSMAETKENYTLKKYGRIFGLNWEALVNDDLNAFTDMLAKFGQSASELVASTLATLVNSNPALVQDTTAVFHANHNNLAGSGTAIDVTSLGTGVAAMRKQKGISGNIVLGVGPRYLLVPAAKEQLAKQYTSNQFVPSQSASINPWTPDIVPIVEPRLDALSSTIWYLFADPAVLPCFEFAYLEGEDGPMITSRMGWETDGIEIKCRLVLGAGATEFRGAYKNPGT
jgi:hypothetical protein